MNKVDLHFTFDLWGDVDYLTFNDAAELQLALDGMINDILAGGDDEINYKAELTNRLTGITVKQSQEAENDVGEH